MDFKSRKSVWVILLLMVLTSVGFAFDQEKKVGSWEAHFGSPPQTDNDLVTTSSSPGADRHGKLIVHGPEISASFESATDWLTGVPVSYYGQAFNNSIVLSQIHWGSNVEAEAYPDVEIRFSSTDSTLCQTFRAFDGYAASGVGVFPGSAWDVSDAENPRRLNICFSEAGFSSPNLRWDPIATGQGGEEYLFIMDSDYDGTGLTYASANCRYGAEEMGIYYFWWPKLTAGHTLLESEPATLTINPLWVSRLIGLPQNNRITLAWTYHKSSAGFNVYSGTSSPPTTLIATVGSDQRRYLHDGLVNGDMYYYRVEALDSSGAYQDGSIELQASPQDMGENMTLLNSWHGIGNYGDVWGYTDQSGHEYALICARDEGIAIIDIEVNPAMEVGFIPSLVPDMDAKDVKIYQHYAVVVKEYEQIQIVDLSDVTNPIDVSLVNLPGYGAHNCMVDGNYLYVVGGSVGGGVDIWDISDPYAPTLAGEFTTVYYHDVAIHGNLLAAALIQGQGIDLLDVSDKSAPVLLRRFNYAGSGAHNVEFSADGRFLFVGDEVGDHNHTRVFDIQDLGSVLQVAEIIVDSNAATHNCYQKDDLLHIAHYTEGLRVWNVVDPTAPFEIAYYDTYQPDRFGYMGAWSVYPYFASGRIIVSDMVSGLFVLGLDIKWPPCCGVYTEGQTGNSDCSDDGRRNLADITQLIDHVYISKAKLCCLENGNVDGDSEAKVNLADITQLIDHVYISKAETAVCN